MNCIARGGSGDYSGGMICTLTTYARKPASQTAWHLTAALAAMLATVGCLSTQQRVERHLTANPDRPEAVRQALLDGDRPVPGMTPQEVRLALGSPARTEKDDSATIWHYDQPKRRSDALQSSDMWALPVPLRTVFFGPDNTVTDIVNYADDPPAAPPAGSPPPPVLTPSRSQPAATPPVRTAPAPAVVIPSYQPHPDEINVYGWPAITLQGLTGSGRASRAVLNGNIREPGEFIGEVRLDAIYANGIVLEYRGRRAFLRPGESTASRETGK